MKCFVGLGTNLGNRPQNLERAAGALRELAVGGRIAVSPAYENPAVLPPGAPPDWDLPYLNAVARFDWTGTARGLLERTQAIERALGRGPAPRWAPRVIDLDLLAAGEGVIDEAGLRVPHPELTRRAFVLDPLKDLAPLLVLPGLRDPVVRLARHAGSRRPGLWAIVNVTPDSFSDGGDLAASGAVEGRLAALAAAGAQAVDIGGESTRPGAKGISVAEEIRRLAPALRYVREAWRGRAIRPRVSVDTRRAEVAAYALESGGVDCVNDVSARAGPEGAKMLEVLRAHDCDYVLMHSLGAPADPRVTLPAGCDPVRELRSWLGGELSALEADGVDRARVIFDPGLGFGKTAEQSREIVRRLAELADLPVRILVGHSRKSFLARPDADRAERDRATLAMSRDLVARGVDLLRVHDHAAHAATFAGPPGSREPREAQDAE